jgi:hypothetical protein
MFDTPVLSLGPVAGPEKLQPMLDKNQEMFNAFVKAVEELAILRNNLNKTEVSLLFYAIGSKFMLHCI